MRNKWTSLAIVALLFAGLMAEDLDAQRRNGNSGNNGRRSSGSSPRPRATPTPRSNPSPRVQTPPSPRSNPSPRVQTPPSPRSNPTPTPRSNPTPTPRSNPTPTPRVRTPDPSPRPDAGSSRRVQSPPTPNRRVDPGSNDRRVEQPTPRSSGDLGSSRTRRVPVPEDNRGRIGADNRRSDASRSDDGGSRIGTGYRSSRERRDEALKRYDSSNRGEPRQSSGSRIDSSPTERSDTGNRSSGYNSRRFGSGSVPGSGFGGDSNPAPSTRSGEGSGADTDATTSRPRVRYRTVFPGDENRRGDDATRSNTDPSATRSRDAFGRGGLTTVEPRPQARREATRGTVPRERVSDDAPGITRRSGAGSDARRLQPLSPSEKAEGRVDRAANAGSGRNDLGAGYFRGSEFWGLDRRDRHHHRHRDHGSFSITFGFGGGRDYCGSYLYGASYSSYWDYWRFGVHSPYHLGYASPAHVSFGYHTSFRHHARYHFGYSYYLPCSRRSPYPFYRTCYYQPWYVDHWSGWCPTYRSYYVIYEDRYRYEPDYYVETSDPYVDEEVLIRVSDIDVVDYDPVGLASAEPALDGGVPVAFQRSFAEGVPLDLDFDQLLAFGEEALFASDYLVASEAFRRAAKLRWEDDYPKFQLALALFGAERFDLSYLALELGLDQNPAWLYRRFDLRDAFESPDEFNARLSALERYLIRNDRNDEARFVLGYLYYFSGNLFGARSVVRILGDSSSSRFPHLDILAREAEKRITRERR